MLPRLVAALGGFVAGMSDPKARLVDGMQFPFLVTRWCEDHRNKVRYQHDVAKAKRFATVRKVVKNERTIRGVEPWRATTWLGR